MTAVLRLPSLEPADQPQATRSIHLQLKGEN
jgi:hypothetical protein